MIDMLGVVSGGDVVVRSISRCYLRYVLWPTQVTIAHCIEINFGWLLDISSFRAIPHCLARRHHAIRKSLQTTY